MERAGSLPGARGRARVWRMFAAVAAAGVAVSAGWYGLHQLQMRRTGAAASTGQGAQVQGAPAGERAGGRGSTAAAMRTMVVRRAPITAAVSALGSLAPINSVDVKINEGGLVKEVLVAAGQTVQAGQIIARLDADDLAAREKQARADLLSAQASLQKLLAGASQADIAAARSNLAQQQLSLTNAEATYAQNKNLFESGAISKQQFDESRDKVELARLAVEAARQKLADLTAPPREADVAAARAQVARAEANLAEVQQDLQAVTIRSPIAGTVVDLPVVAGQTLGNNGLVATVADLRRMQATVYVNEIDIPQVRTGQETEIRVDALQGRMFRGEVTQVGQMPGDDNNVVTYPVVSVLPNPQGLLRPGMTVDVNIVLGKSEAALVVPVEALVDAGGRTAVLVPGAAADGQPGRPEPRPVQVGLRNDTFVEIVGGLEEGDQILVPQAAGVAAVGAGQGGRMFIGGPGGVPGVPGGGRPVVRLQPGDRR